jgi:hypothetical protein
MNTHKGYIIIHISRTTHKWFLHEKTKESAPGPELVSTVDAICGLVYELRS